MSADSKPPQRGGYAVCPNTRMAFLNQPLCLVAVEFVNVNNQNSMAVTPAILLDGVANSRVHRYAIATSLFGCLDQIGENVFVRQRVVGGQK
jgi:hypothetical protein